MREKADSDSVQRAGIWVKKGCLYFLYSRISTSNSVPSIYIRVLEIPTPRWTTYDAAFYGVDLPKGVESIQQERAYALPIWYTP